MLPEILLGRLTIITLLHVAVCHRRLQGDLRRLLWLRPAATAVPSRSFRLTPSAVGMNRPNTKRPRHPSWDRLQLLELSKPKFTQPHPTTQNLFRECPRETELQEKQERSKANAFEMLFVQELNEFMRNSKMIGIFHANIITHYPHLWVCSFDWHCP